MGEVGGTNLYIPISAHSCRRVGGTRAVEEDWRDTRGVGGARGGGRVESHVRREAWQCRTWRRNLEWSHTSCGPSSPLRALSLVSPLPFPSFPTSCVHPSFSIIVSSFFSSYLIICFDPTLLISLRGSSFLHF